MATSNDLPPPPSVPPHQYQYQYQQQQQQQQQQYQGQQLQQQQQQQQQQQYQQQFQQIPPQYLPPKQTTTASQQRPAAQTRKSRSFSFRSDKSGSGNHKIDLHETSAEKEAKRLHGKADPTLAMNEAEPAEVAAQVKSSLAPLRSIQHKDAYGNPIADPDKSNPTRSRWERPLDTIRSFEAAIDGQYSSRRSMLRSDSESVAWGNNRRSSYYNGGSRQLPRNKARAALTYTSTDGGARFSNDSYYGNSRPPSMMYSSRPDGSNSQHDLRQGGAGPRDNYYDHQGPGGSYAPGPYNQGRRGYPRMLSEPPPFAPGARQQGHGDYAIPANHRSYETVASASGSGSSAAEPSGYQTDPTSSDNSSIERVQAAPKPQPPPNDYGIGFSPSSTYQPPAFTVGYQPTGLNGGANGYAMTGGGAPPPVPQKGPMPVLRKPTTVQVQQRPAAPEKRKSWFARRFSKAS